MSVGWHAPEGRVLPQQGCCPVGLHVYETWPQARPCSHLQSVLPGAATSLQAAPLSLTIVCS